jgi:hypothetical protein
VAPSWVDDELFELTEGEAANSVAALNSLLDEVEDTSPSDDEIARLRATAIAVERTGELLDELRDYVPIGEFVCESMEYAVPDPSFRFDRVLTIPLRP